VNSFGMIKYNIIYYLNVLFTLSLDYKRFDKDFNVNGLIMVVVLLEL